MQRSAVCNLTTVSKSIHSCNYHLKQDLEHFLSSRKSPIVPCQSILISQRQPLF